MSSIVESEGKAAPVLTADLELARTLADLADEITMDRFRAGDLMVSSKPDLTPVSDADRSVEQIIRKYLAEQRPEDAFLGEETGVSRPVDAGQANRQWVIDPIDGTKNYVRGVPIWATLIALMVAGRPVLGMVSAPALGQRWWASLGGGAFCQRGSAPAERIAVSTVAQLADASFSYASLSAWRQVDRYPQVLTLLDTVWRSRAYGDFYSYMLLAEGALDLAAEPELSLWDMAALAPIVEEAGGRFTGLNGEPGVLHENALASNGALHAAALNLLGV